MEQLQLSKTGVDGMRAWVSRHFYKAMPPVLFFVLVVAAWQVAVTWFDLPIYLLPSPWRVAREAVSERQAIVQATTMTAAAALCGFAASLVIGTLVGFVFSQSAAIRSSCYPYAIFLQTVPIVAIAPLIITWFDYGFHSVVLVALIISLFPIITNATAGMLAVDPPMLDLFRLYDASRWQVLFRLRLPNSVPYLVVAAKTSSGLAVVGAIVGEFFVGAGMNRFGLGFLIRQKLEQLRTAELFAAVIASAVLGVAIFAVVSLTGTTVLARWYNPAATDRLQPP
jgi:NitT/TauT family transport system permease protein